VTSARVGTFLPSTNGLHFTNYFPHEPEIQIQLPLGGTLGLGDAANGLCGGMVYTVCDYFEAGTPIPPDTDPPPGGSVLYRYIVQRLLQSFHLPFGLNRYLELMTPWLPDGARTTAVREQEWPAARARIDAGHPVPFGLIKIKSARPRDLCQQHQVLAYGYDLADDSSSVSLLLYDPNFPNRDDLRLSLGLTGPPTLSYSTGEPVYAFFCTRYSPRVPSPVAA
jgi:hypothetical protein